ncbi:hypothetical protein K438DRAFT_2038692 [Mycena galopus ATCC 62051]|nr:hypothetical protein K438DRAFT_2038692 [Mycena galopus ATCC 62051]
MDVDNSPTQPVRTDGRTCAEDLWFEDCGLIIQAESTIFRVSGAILASQSTVFRDMLSIPKPKDVDTLDDCPFVLLPDTAEDVGTFLRTIFCYGFFEPFPVPTTFAILFSVLRMSHKYDAAALRKRAFVHLAHAHPTKLGEWDRLRNSLPAWTQYDPTAEDQDMFLVALARQLNAPWILPTTFYRICQSSYERTIIMENDLSDSDKVNCVQGLRYLGTTGAGEMLDFLWGPYNDCSNAAACNASRLKLHRQVARRGYYDPQVANIMPLELWLAVHWDRLDVCVKCLSEMKAAHGTARKKLWDSLPKVFGLGDWTKLEEMKAEALKCDIPLGFRWRHNLMQDLEKQYCLAGDSVQRTYSTQMVSARQKKTAAGCISKSQSPDKKYLTGIVNVNGTLPIARSLVLPFRLKVHVFGILSTRTYSHNLASSILSRTPLTLSKFTLKEGTDLPQKGSVVGGPHLRNLNWKKSSRRRRFDSGSSYVVDLIVF